MADCNLHFAGAATFVQGDVCQNAILIQMLSCCRVVLAYTLQLP